MRLLAAAVAATALAALGGSLRARTTSRLVQELGDPQRSEAAERELLALGTAARLRWPPRMPGRWCAPPTRCSGNSAGGEQPRLR